MNKKEVKGICRADVLTSGTAINEKEPVIWLNCFDEFLEVVTVDMPGAVGLDVVEVEELDPLHHAVVGDLHLFVERLGEGVDVGPVLGVEVDEGVEVPEV